ncbi:DUF883 family protein [Bordetella genomosp. 13]|uniref:DUF883 domain-containing protein n=1 Tax=Bordetella genomosp. 13 TaxID=463040 RepID=A0A1W6ZA48_9BORD|nr:DUF883 family protein [Bordetella genomosp. 13]ARP94115.1 hypothetical protein CAL15_06785 [Bordetella genomosp. 13]
MFFRTEHDRTSESRLRVKRSLRDLTHGADELLRATASFGGAEMESARDRLKQQLERAREHSAGWERSAVDGYRRIAGAADGYVHQNSWKVIGIGVALGLLAGICLMSDHSRRR